ncbi:hypothetical protein LTR91_017371 [Friedmanniomyces endolithicus]|uniref:Uncharacterized protein n=1 Tax=Friedmanniomyces endolithicus TaxID=329885 RepID=A0AAN6QJH2_9PEZI|nr:hypothetical protein LTS09_016600 [Friedmanniomyces endolithicus]KAK0305752.1 hypothetical protein LTR01_006536 [Friedmanniomyces endolithicus]KAK0830784.1 hypothetical protein LTR73_003170 [Friedmanniomyces endolithicus]KAK0912920.1 hypothetical protein LTR57_014666 [Friedmanniomyces endolithicus]KAK0964528.1 hypothetical protein LTS01_018793 [Friedmanniomyces endolithicus]
MAFLPALRRKPAFRDLRIASNILSLVLSHPRQPGTCLSVGLTDECLTTDTNLASLIPLPLFHGRSSAHRGNRPGRTTDVAAEVAEQTSVDWDELVPFPEYDEAYATELLQQSFLAELSWENPGSSESRRRVADEATSHQSRSRQSESRSQRSLTSPSQTHSSRTPDTDLSATQEAREAATIAGAECDYGESSSSLSTGRIVDNETELHDDETDMLRTLHGFPYDLRCRPYASCKPEQTFWKSCALMEIRSPNLIANIGIRDLIPSKIIHRSLHPRYHEYQLAPDLADKSAEYSINKMIRSTRQYDWKGEDKEDHVREAAVPVYLEQQESALEHTAALVPSPRRTAISQTHGIAPATRSSVVERGAIAVYGRPPTHQNGRRHDSWIAARDGRAWPTPAQRQTSQPTGQLPSPTRDHNCPERDSSENEQSRDAVRRRHEDNSDQRRNNRPDDSGVRDPVTRPEELRRDARRADMLWTTRITTYRATPEKEPHSE